LDIAFFIRNTPGLRIVGNFFRVLRGQRGKDAADIREGFDRRVRDRQLGGLACGAREVIPWRLNPIKAEDFASAAISGAS